jgi:CubicO group peptidase (beta-lactamase class C family)
VAIVQNGQVVLKKGYGFASLDPRRTVDPDTTLFRLGTLSRTFTWVLLMKEVEAGRIRLDRPVNLYLPEKVRLTGRGRNVMVGHLLDHSAGFEARVLGRFEEDNPRRVRPLELYLRENRPSVVRTPGLLSSDADYDAALAGEAVGFVSGETFERRAEDQIFVPLGMAHTSFREPRDERRGLPAAMPQALRGDLARGYGWRDAGFMADSYEYVGQAAPAAGASSTAGDMARFMRVLLADGRTDTGVLFGPLAARAFRSPMRLTPAGINGWAHGFMTFALPGGHQGFGHRGEAIAFQSNLVLVPQLGLGVFVATNSEQGRAVADGLPLALVRHFHAPAAGYPRLGSAALAGQGPVYDGHYLSTRRAYGGLEGFVGLLRHGADVRVTSGGRLVVAGAAGATAWVPDGPLSDNRFVSTTSDDHLAFNLRAGQAWSFEPADNTELFERATLWERPSTFLALATLAAAAGVFTLTGAMLRSRRELRQNAVQARASLVQNIQAGLWLTALGLFAAWWRTAADAQALMYGWPGPLIVTASACALVAAGLSLVTIAALPAVWQGGRRVDSWTATRKVFFTLTVLIYAGLSVALAMGGALEPWSG